MKKLVTILLLLIMAVLWSNEVTSAQDQPPSITISSPVEGESLNLGFITVSGDAVGLPKNSLIVQVQDADGVVLGGQPATVATDTPGGVGAWTVRLEVRAAPGTSGRIYAYAQSPEDNSVLAEAVVNVTFGSTDTEPIPTEVPTEMPTEEPTQVPTELPTEEPTEIPTEVPTEIPTEVPTTVPTVAPTAVPTAVPTEAPTERPTAVPTPSPTAGPTQAPTAIPTPTATAAARPAVRITAPRPSEVVDPVRFEVSGTGVALPDNTVTVRALDARGVVIAEASTTMDSMGTWRVVIQPDAVPGTIGTLVAFALDPASGSVWAVDRIRVTYGVPPTPVAPTLEITQPQDGALVDASTTFEVAGTAQGLAQGYVIVQLQDMESNVLYQTVTAVNPDGFWSAPLHIRIADGTPARIYAYSTFLADNSIVADDLVAVTFSSNCSPRTDWPIYGVRPGDTLFVLAQQTGTTVGDLVLANCITNPNVLVVGQQLRVPTLPVPGIVNVPPIVTIDAPIAGAALPVETPVLVSGSSAWVVAGGVVVRALDNNGVVLDETRVDPTSIVSNGQWTWEVELDLGDASPGTHGTLFAYAPSLIDGSISTAAGVDVIYGEDSSPAFISILSPQPYASVSLDTGSTISGQARGLPGQSLVVVAEDVFGRELARQPAVVESQAIDVLGNWTVALPTDYVGRGRITALAVDPATGATIAQAARDVYFGDPTSLGIYTLITYPLPGTVIRGGDDLRAIAGYAHGILDESVYLSVLDSDNRMRFVLPVPIDAQTGFWSLTPLVELSLSRDGEVTLSATATAPTTGQILANDSVRLRLEQPKITGDVTYLERIALPPDAVVRVQVVDQLLADAPPEMTVLGEQVITAPGQVPIEFAVPYNPARVNENTIYGITVTIRDATGNLLFINSEPVPVLTQGNPSEDVEIVVQMP